MLRIKLILGGAAREQRIISFAKTLMNERRFLLRIH